jgi:hypothetical protein
MEKHGQSCSGSDDVHIAAKMDTQRRRQAGPAAARHGLRSSVKHRRTGDVGKDRRGGEKGDKQFGRRHYPCSCRASPVDRRLKRKLCGGTEVCSQPPDGDLLYRQPRKPPL